jgi:hypothetical protein
MKQHNNYLDTASCLHWSLSSFFFSFPFPLSMWALYLFLLSDPMKQHNNYLDSYSCLHWSLSSFFFFPFCFTWPDETTERVLSLSSLFVFFSPFLLVSFFCFQLFPSYLQEVEKKKKTERYKNHSTPLLWPSTQLPLSTNHVYVNENPNSALNTIQTL